MAALLILALVVAVAVLLHLHSSQAPPQRLVLAARAVGKSVPGPRPSAADGSAAALFALPIRPPSELRSSGRSMGPAGIRRGQLDAYGKRAARAGLCWPGAGPSRCRGSGSRRGRTRRRRTPWRFRDTSSLLTCACGG